MMVLFALSNQNFNTDVTSHFYLGYVLERNLGANVICSPLNRALVS